MDRISIISPVFKVEQFLPKCIQSVQNQTYPNWELLLIDDGSPDASGALCEKYAITDNRIKVFHKTNGGLSDARNFGLEKATGEYVFFLDSDDWIASDTLNTLLSLAKIHQSEIVQGGIYYAFADYLEVDERYHTINSGPYILTKEEAMVELIRNQAIKSFACGKLYKASLLKRHKFPLGLFFEDCYWQHLVINDCNKFCLCTQPLYFYRQREDSISGSFSIRNLDLVKGYAERLRFITKYYPQYTSPMQRLYRNLAIQTMERAYSQADESTIQRYEEYLIENHIYYNRIVYKISLFINKVWFRLFSKRLTRVNIKEVQ